MTPAVILLDDNIAAAEALAEAIELAGFSCRACSTWHEAEAHVDRNAPLVVLTDVRMPGCDGFQVLGAVMAIDDEIPVIMISGHADIPMAIDAIRRGAYEFIEKPAKPSDVIEVLNRAAMHRRLTLAHRALKGENRAHDIAARIIGIAPAMVRLRELILDLARVEATVLVHGETGTGKELVARSLHEFGPRARGPFVAINCAGLPQGLIESELFGHEPGAFTGARDRRIGRIEAAHRGTLFLDEIESMPLEAQTRLLRVLQEREVERIGGQRRIPVDVRVVAATKHDLTALAVEGRFREDLVYRLNVIPVDIPALRERGPEDIAFLFRHFFAEAAGAMREKLAKEPPLDLLAGYSWPGNVRELKNAAQRAALGFPMLPSRDTLTASGPRDLGTLMAAHEKREIEIALARGGLLQDIAAELGISRKSLYLKLREYGLKAQGE